MRKRAPRSHEQIFAVTGLPPSLDEDQRARVRRYLLSMGFRTASFLLAVFTLTVLHWTVVGWLFVLAAAVLPYIAVVLANAARSRGSVTLGPVTHNDGSPPQLSPGPPDEEHPNNHGRQKP